MTSEEIVKAHIMTELLCAPPDSDAADMLDTIKLTGALDRIRNSGRIADAILEEAQVKKTVPLATDDA